MAENTIGSTAFTGSPDRSDTLDQLEAFIGRWITEGDTEADASGASAPIVSSDVYEWAVGKRVVIHPVHGRIGDAFVSGLEVISQDNETGQFKTHFFDQFGNVSSQSLTHRDGVWTWSGPNRRCTGTFENGGKTLVAQHERSEDGITWQPSMLVNIRRVD